MPHPQAGTPQFSVRFLHEIANPLPCCVCGAGVPQDGAQTRDGWRIHPGCAALDEAGILAVLDVHATQSDARLLWKHGLGIDLYAMRYRERQSRADGCLVDAWSYVTDGERAGVRTALTEQVPALRPRTGPARCTDGACWACGRRIAASWHESSLRWPDGTPAPVCGVCAGSYRHRGEPGPSEPQALAVWVRETATGVPPYSGDVHPDWLVGWGATGSRDGQAKPWDHLPHRGLSDYRLTLWGRHPKHAPDEMRGIAVKRYRALMIHQRREAAEAARQRRDLGIV